MGALIVGLTIALAPITEAPATTASDAHAGAGMLPQMAAPGQGATNAAAQDQARAEDTAAGQSAVTTAPPPIDKSSDQILRVDSTGELVAAFERMNYSFSDVLEGEPVPRVLLTRLPTDLGDINDVSLRKSVFFNVMLPLVLRVNEDIAQDRQRLLALRQSIEDGAELSAGDRTWLAALAQRYRAEPDDLDTLVARVDTVPPSMALAQAAVESGWGTSEFTQSGNVLFGVITTSGNGIHGATGHVYAVYQRLIDATAGYVRTLNTHPAYISFRAVRSDLRARNETLDGHLLMGELHAYSELGDEYIAYIRNVMRINDLQLVDEARLAQADTTVTADLL